MLRAREYLRDGHVADESGCLLQLTGGHDGDVGEAVDVAVSEEEGRECLWRREESMQSHTVPELGKIQFQTNSFENTLQ